MTTATRKRPKTQVFSSGPWNGVINASDKAETSKDKLYAAQNMLISGAEQGGGWQMRAPFVIQQAGGTLGTAGGRYGQCIFEHIRLDGTIDRFLFVGGKLIVWNGASTYTDITPTNISISTTARIACLTFANVLIVNDGVNPPWQYDPATAVATYIAYGTAAANLLSIGAPTTTLAVAQFRYPGNGVVTTVGPTASVPFVAGTTVTVSLWGVFRVSITQGGSFVVTPQAALMAFASEALAHAAAPAVPAGNWDLGVVTLQSNAGVNWRSTIDALAGGGGATPAQVTNYYASSVLQWAAFGKPVVNGGALHFIVDNVNGASLRTDFIWSEPAQPLVGYRQTGYANTWTLTQTEADPLYALAATNSALYYFRRDSIGAITGVVGPNYQAGATLDSVSTDVGSTTPFSVIVAHNAVWFLDDNGKPWRFAFGAAPEPIWLQARDATIVNGSNALASIAQCAISINHPDIEMVLMASFQSSASAQGASVLYAFNATTGEYRGTWDCDGGRIIHTMGVLRDASDHQSLCILGDAVTASTPTSGTFLRQRVLSEMLTNVWNDPTNGYTMCSVLTHQLGVRDVGEWMFDLIAIRARASQIGVNINMQMYYYTPRGGQSTIFTVNMSTPQLINGSTMGFGRGIVGVKADGRDLSVLLDGHTLSAQQTGLLPAFMPDLVTVTAIDGGADPLAM
jgi:hypothetical protein